MELKGLEPLNELPFCWPCVTCGEPFVGLLGIRWRL